MTRVRVNWPELVVTAGLAATVAAIGGFASEAFKKTAEGATERCAMAAQFLQDDALNPYIDVVRQKRLVSDTAARFDRCMRE